MPLDTSIPLQVQVPQLQDYSQLAAQTQMNALRAQVLQQEMQQNALTMQNTMEDRRRAEANRAAAAAKAAEDKLIWDTGQKFGDRKKAKTYYEGLGRYDMAAKIDAYEKGAAESSKATVEADKAKFVQGFAEVAPYASLIANGIAPATAVVDAVVKHPIVGPYITGLMSRDDIMKFAAENPDGVAAFLASPPDKTYDAIIANRQAKPVEMDLGGKKAFVDTNPQSATYMKSVGEFNKVAPATDVTELKKGEYIDPETGRVKAAEGSDIYIAQSGKHGKDFNAVKTIQSSTDDAIANIDKILSPENEDAFNSNFGGYNAYATRMLPGKTQTIAAAIKKLDSLMSATGAQLMRSQGGAVGSITEREWPILKGLVASLNPTLPEQDAREIIQEVKQRLINLNDIAKETYDTTWGNTQYYKPDAGNARASATPATTPSGASVSNW